MKRKTLTLVLCLLTVMSLVGVGFASWVISANDTEKVGGNIVVDTVEDKRLVLTVNENDQNIVFAGTPKDYVKKDSDWLILGGDSTTEGLIVTYTCSVKYKGLDENGKALTFATTTKEEKKYINVDLNCKYAEPENDALNSAKTAGCIEYKGTEITNVELSADSTTVTFNVVITYAWGSIFGNVNPFTYYNNQDVEGNLTSEIKIGSTTLKQDNTWGDHAAFFLGLLDKIDNDSATVAYSLTISA